MPRPTSYLFIMCGRYVIASPPEALATRFQARGPVPNLPATWNMAPTREAPVLRRHPDTGERHLGLLRWGLVPHWAKDLKSTRQPINARGETIAATPMFRDAYARRRCLVPADAFYEWQAAEGHPPAKSPAKLPWAVARKDGAGMVLAGVWEGWRGPDGVVIRSYAIVTTTAHPDLRFLHERMPVVLEDADWPLWLGESEGDPGTLIRPSEAGFRLWRVGTEVNNVRNDAASLLDPV